MDDEVVQSLIESGLYASAEFLGSFNISSNGSTLSLVQFGQSLYELGDYRRALKYFNMASDQEKQHSVKQIEIKQKSAECLIKLKEDKFALKILKEIHEHVVGAQSMTTKSYLTLARLVSQFDGKKKALPYYKHVLKEAPYAVEAIFALIDGGVSLAEIKELTKGSIVEIKWLGTLYEAHQLQSRSDFNGSISKYVELLSQFPQNLHLLKNLAICHYQNSNAEVSLAYFKQIRKIDATFVETMDVFAHLIKCHGQITELNRLSHDLLQANPYRAETWTAIAMYYDAKGKKEKALFHIDKALDLDAYHAMAHYYKGLIYCSLKQFDLAVQSLRTVRSIHKNLPLYKALVSAYLSLHDHTNAVTSAKEAQNTLGPTPSVMCLMGLVHVHSRDSTEQDKGKGILLEALKRDSTCIDAVTGLCTLYKIQEKYDDAIKLLKQYLEKYNTELLHTMMGDVLTATEKYAEAIIHYDNALKLNPLCEAALAGRAAVETQIHGPEPTEEHEDEEANNNNFEEEFES